MKKITFLCIGIFSGSSYAARYNPAGHSNFLDVLPILLLILGILSFFTYIGYVLSDKKDKFFTENNIVLGIHITFLVLIFLAFLLEIYNGKFGMGTVLLVLYGSIYYWDHSSNKKKSESSVMAVIKKPEQTFKNDGVSVKKDSNILNNEIVRKKEEKSIQEKLDEFREKRKFIESKINAEKKENLSFQKKITEVKDKTIYIVNNKKCFFDGERFVPFDDV